MKKIIMFLLMFLMTFSLIGCNFTGSVGVIESTSNKKVSLKFRMLNMTKKYTLKADKDTILTCSASLESGIINVYYEINENKRLLFTINGGDAFEDESIDVGSGTITIYIEANGKCNKGKFIFNLE